MNAPLLQGKLINLDSRHSGIHSRQSSTNCASTKIRIMDESEVHFNLYLHSNNNLQICSKLSSTTRIVQAQLNVAPCTFTKIRNFLQTFKCIGSDRRAHSILCLTTYTNIGDFLQIFNCIGPDSEAHFIFRLTTNSNPNTTIYSAWLKPAHPPPFLCLSPLWYNNQSTHPAIFSQSSIAGQPLHRLVPSSQPFNNV